MWDSRCLGAVICLLGGVVDGSGGALLLASPFCPAGILDALGSQEGASLSSLERIFQCFHVIFPCTSRSTTPSNPFNKDIGYFGLRLTSVT